MNALTSEEVSERVADLTGHEFDLTCDGRPTVEQCGEPARWAVLFSCRDDRLWCDNHHARGVMLAATAAGSIHCLTCGTQEITIVHIEPLGGNRA